MLHKDILVSDVHVVQNWEVADETARLALTLASTDIGRIAYQLSDKTFWILNDDSAPTWLAVGGAGGGGGIDLDTVNVFTKKQMVASVELVQGSSVTPTNADSNSFTLTANQNFLLVNPDGSPSDPGANITIVIEQDDTGSRLISYDSAYTFPVGHDKTLSTAPNSVDMLVCFRYWSSSTHDGNRYLCQLIKDFAAP